MKNITKVLIIVAVVASALVAFKLSSKPIVVPTPKAAQFRPCVWPNTCGVTTDVVQFQTCVWPNRCTNNG